MPNSLTTSRAASRTKLRDETPPKLGGELKAEQPSPFRPLKGKPKPENSEVANSTFGHDLEKEKYGFLFLRKFGL